jgi:oxygen-independent coproporphyrinogen-3 oxidase
MKSISQTTNQRHLDQRVPRYTSYPPANHFNGAVTAYHTKKWLHTLPSQGRISLYVHIPFCRNLCWFCACRTQGLKQRFSPLYSYIETVQQELDLVRAMLPKDVVLDSVHLGGGTPTLMPAALSARLLRHIKDLFAVRDSHKFSVEIDPTEIDEERLDVLVAAGLTRASVGIQDFNPLIQKAIGRPQSFDETKRCFDMLRACAINSINVDLLYGLPHQTVTGFTKTMEKVINLAPDRIALFGYAHVPWVARRQVMIDQQALPDSEKRRELLETGRQIFVKNGYQALGIDHFALPDDQLFIAASAGQLHRNFQGYTDDQSAYLIGVGASAISRYPQGYAQNAAGTKAYMEMISNMTLATSRGHVFNQSDKIRGDIIEQLMCHFRINLTALRQQFGDAATDLCDAIQAQAKGLGLTSKDNSVFEIEHAPHLTARLVARHFDEYSSETKSHSLAV